MNGSNALQITDPNADNPLAQAPSWADAAGSVAGTVSSGGDPLQQWLAAQRAKRSQSGLAWQYGQRTMTDASSYNVNVGNERSDPVFSDKYWRQGMLWQQMDTARMLANADPSPARQQAYELASHAYLTSLDDPTLPEARLQTRLDAASAQSPVDANVIMQAIQRRQQLGR
jgi:hypothetical protein